MVKFTFEEPASMPVSTSFISRFMPGAPPEYVKVYLYGLYIAYSRTGDVNLEDALHLSAAQIASALDYWQNKGLIVKEGGSYRWLAERDETVDEYVPGAPEMYPRREFNEALNELFGRVLSKTDLNKIYDYTDIFKLPEDVVLHMIAYCTESKGSSVSLNYIDKVARSWAEAGIFTVELAKQQIEEHAAAAAGARKVMRRMGIVGKNPGKTERDFYDKWTRIWGFSLGSILAAMDNREFASASQPFKYLDEILRPLFEKGITQAGDVAGAAAADQALRNSVKQILSALEYTKKNVTSRQIEFYRRWQDEGYPMPVILLACRQTVKSGYKRFESVESFLKEWAKLGLADEEQINAHIARQDKVAINIARVYERAGISKTISDYDKKLYTDYTETHGMSHDVLMYAAEISSVKASEPLPYMKKLLFEWQKSGVITLADAQKQDLSRFYTGGAAKKGFYQRTFEEDDRERIRREMLAGLDDED